MQRPRDSVSSKEAQGSARGSVDHTSTGWDRHEVSPAVVKALGGKKVDRKYPSMGVGDRSTMFFRVVETSRADGKTRVTVEAEDSSVKLLLQFLATASDFAYLFRYKSEADLKAQDRAVERLAAEPARRAQGNEILSMYRSMKGVPQHKRYQLIRDELNARGFDYTYSQVEGLVTRAIHDEQDEKHSRARSEGAVGSTVVQRKGSNARVPTRVPLSEKPDHRVRLVSAVDTSANCREAGPEILHDCAMPKKPQASPSLREERFGCTDRKRGAARMGSRTGGE